METPLLSSLIDLVEQHYVLPGRVPRITATLRSYHSCQDKAAPEVVASEWTKCLLEGSGDLHLRVRTRPGGHLDQSWDDFEARVEREARAHSGGVRSVIRVDASTAVIEIAPYLSEVHLSAGYLDAAFALVADVRQLIIDVRAGAGGTPAAVAHVCGYLFGAQRVHLQDVVERDGSTQQFWTTAHPRRLPTEVHLAVLTSKETFSGCEELAYDLQALGRAVVVGESTRGGAHPVQTFPLAEDLEVAIPVARSINATTGSNWEGTGVTPDITTPAEDAFTAALAHLREGAAA